MLIIPGPEASGSHSTGIPPQVLVVDRQPLFLAALGRLLSGPPIDAQIRMTTRSDHVFEVLDEGPVDAVFCEVRATPLPGIDLAAAVSQRQPGIPVVLLGDSNEENLLLSALGSRAMGFFTKDTPVNEFLDGVQAILAGHYAIGRNLAQTAMSRLAEHGNPANREVATNLSSTERSILAMIGQAQSIATIAGARGISQKTVRNHLSSIYRKLQLHSRTEAMLWASRMGVTSSP
jgi:DNA-binding NarL/FixJ family response regulator